MHELITEENVKKVKEIHNDEIGLHIRMGDFRKLNVGEEFNGGHVRTPESFFINIINNYFDIIFKIFNCVINIFFQL